MQMWQELALVVVGLLSVATGQFTTAELTIFRARGVVVKNNGETYTFSHAGTPDHEVRDHVCSPFRYSFYTKSSRQYQAVIH